MGPRHRESRDHHNRHPGRRRQSGPEDAVAALDSIEAAAQVPAEGIARGGSDPGLDRRAREDQRKPIARLRRSPAP
jgi:hypothetical protein